jgi:hypothetical protein
MNTSSGINIPDFQIENGMSLEDLFSNEETAASSALNSGESAMSLEDMQTSMIQQGPRNGPPPPPQSDDMLSSIIDSDEDELWSVDELTDFSEALISTMQTSFDVSEIMDQYDTDGDGTIDASERVAMKEDNAFNLSPPDRDLVNPTDATSNLENISSLYLQNALEAYDFSSNYQNNMTLTFSMSQA